jgi:hypothetical protein
MQVICGALLYYSLRAAFLSVASQNPNTKGEETMRAARGSITVIFLPSAFMHAS